MLGTLPGPLPGTWCGGTARAINAAGQVVGNYRHPIALYSGECCDFGSRAFLWERGTGLTELAPLPDDEESYAADIDAAGRVVGTSTRLARVIDSTGEGFDRQFKAVLWQRGREAVVLPPLPGYRDATASAVSDNGVVVGASVVAPAYPEGPAGPSRPTLWRIRTNASQGAPAVDRLLAGALAPDAYPQYAPNGGVWLRVRLTDADDAAGPDVRWRWEIDWGDGAIHTPTVGRKGEFVFLRSTPYATAGPHTITARVTDPGGRRVRPRRPPRRSAGQRAA